MARVAQIAVGDERGERRIEPKDAESLSHCAPGSHNHSRFSHAKVDEIVGSRVIVVGTVSQPVSVNSGRNESSKLSALQSPRSVAAIIATLLFRLRTI